MAPTDLLPPDDNAALRDLIAARIRAEGPITFRDFMELALYHPQHGYYVACDPSRDYQSSPNVHPIFGACIARQLAEMWHLLGRPARFDVVEAGAGSGRLAADIVAALRQEAPDVLDALRYHLQDRTYTDTRRLDAATSMAGLPTDKASASAQLPGLGELAGCVLSNELIDAFPVHRVRVEAGRLLELRVGLDGDAFVDVSVEPQPAVRCYFEHLGLLPGEGCDAEANLEAAGWLRAAAASLRRGYILTLDYGYEAADMYAPWRKRGTLLTFYRHTSGEDPYVRAGLQDITASVDFTTLMREGEACGLRNLGLTTQTEFLAALGIGASIVERPDPARLEEYYALRRAVIELMDPAGLGRIRVLAQAKDVPDARLAGFTASEASDA